MQEYIKFHNHNIDKSLHDFICKELKSEKIKLDKIFWKKLSNIISELENRRINLIEKRAFLQNKITNWHKKNKGKFFNKNDYKKFLFEIGYIVEEKKDFKINTNNIDPEISSIPSPQLVVPLSNTRYAINAANSRWGSLYDALYGTDMISESDGAIREGGYNPLRGNKVIAFAKNFLDETFPLKNGNFNKVVNFEFIKSEIAFTLDDNSKTALLNKDQYVGYMDKGQGSYGLLFKNNNLHIEIQVDRSHPIGQDDPAGIKDILVESAITTIQDCEDSERL